jgi:hypothetical protein
MTPKEKAQELWWKFFHAQATEENGNLDGEIAYQCALIAVEEMIKEVYNISHQYTALYIIVTNSYYYEESKELKFWIEVKKEIEAL